MIPFPLVDNESLLDVPNPRDIIFNYKRTGLVVNKILDVIIKSQ